VLEASLGPYKAKARPLRTSMGDDHLEVALSAAAWTMQVLDSSNELMVQEATSYVDGLEAKPWHDPATHKWAKKLESKWRVVRDELRDAMADAEALSAKGTNVWEATAPGTYGPGWRTLPLCDRTVWDSTNAALFPRTCELLHSCKVPVVEAFFSSMAPRSDIAPHSDMCNFVLTAHLGLIVPPGACELTVGDEAQQWADGKAMLFDTSILHRARNDSDETRYILMMRIYHPDLTALERKALQLIFDCLDEPEILDDQDALAQYDERRRALEEASRAPWQEALALRRTRGRPQKRR